MKKALVTIYFGLLFSYVTSQSIEIGFGLGSDFGINRYENSDYNLFLSDMDPHSSLTSFDIYMKIPIGNAFIVYPTIIFPLSDDYYSLENLNGELRPGGNTISLPYKEVGSGWTVDYITDDYIYHKSEALYSQFSLGSFITKNLVAGLNVGTGLFVKHKKIVIDDYLAKDEYIWSHSIDTQLDVYEHYETFSYKSETTTHKSLHISIPAIIEYTISIDNLAIGASFISYISRDTYYSFRLTFGYLI